MRVSVKGNISQIEVDDIIREEELRYAARGKELGEIEIVEISPEELEVRSRAKTTIKRVRRITGYLSTVDRFNDAKQAELVDRVVHN
ncbi:anaerobic ribonucleoside-triphosphate reductase [Desulforamulus putei]|uniref:Anaerobic ribonucleoside-triphosphate reductase n=1 Tax=Desulforamulus putei DSM 12395 TaxID=1121429 RepID=A0A1M4ZLJ8_9FIRM|nr:anaerobic ribonucleoside-triphosphate reductase [Desulforamulus putei]SHF18682.1 Anaerobic ribonucleoside-triphosphate reductase [Desulforamulus putei DSM 12395]